MLFVSTRIANALRELAAEMPVSLRVSGECMAPLLESGALIQVARQPFYWPGDLMVVQAPDGHLLVHRLLGYYSKGRGWRCLTQADNATQPDSALPLTHVVGRVVGSDGHAYAIRIPFRHRLWACGRFFRHALRAARRWW